MSNYCQNCYELAEENDRLKEEIKRIGEMRKCYKENLKLCKFQEQQINKLATKLEKIKEVINECMKFKMCKSCKFYKECDKNMEEYIIKIIEGAEDDD